MQLLFMPDNFFFFSAGVFFVFTVCCQVTTGKQEYGIAAVTYSHRLGVDLDSSRSYWPGSE